MSLPFHARKLRGDTGNNWCRNRRLGSIEGFLTVVGDPNARTLSLAYAAREIARTMSRRLLSISGHVFRRSEGKRTEFALCGVSGPRK
jgi:hypothetical protein